MEESNTPRPRADASNSTKKRKRARAIQACERCREKKYKCDELYPACTHCKKAAVDCWYERGRAYDHGQDMSYVKSLEARVDVLTASLDNQAAATSSHPPASQTLADYRSDASPSSFTRHHGGTLVAISERGARRASTVAGDNNEHEAEITDLNQHTNGMEFHGSTSSMSFLDDLRKFPPSTSKATDHSTPQQHESLVSALHNSAFSKRLFPSPKPGIASSKASKDGRYYFAQSHAFIDSYFTGVHYIHPIIDKDSFMERANNLWFGNTTSLSSSFLALYLSLLSFGALMMTWQQDTVDGHTRFQWSRRLFSEALQCLNEVQFSNDLDTVHALYLMAKICQNELNPHLAWMYLGRAIRTCISAGFNRETSNPRHSPEILARTWWGLFSLEIETSFSLGRADSLGLDEYHNRQLPQSQEDEYAIIPCMVDLGYIIRNVSLLYNAKLSTHYHDLNYIFRLDAELDSWLERVPKHLRPVPDGPRPLSALREPEWCRKQRLVLEIRHSMVKMALFRHFMDIDTQAASRPEQHRAADLSQCTEKCVLAATRLVHLIYEAYKNHVYFRTWWYNTTYIMMAAAAILSYIKRAKPNTDASLIQSTHMAIEILDAMDESVVSRKCAELLKKYLEEVNSTSTVPCSNLTTLPAHGYGEGLPGLEFGMDQPGDYEILDFSFADMATLFQGFNNINNNQPF